MTKVSTIKKEGQLSHAIRVETDNDTFNIPVIDVRDGEKARISAEKVLKQANIAKGSKYFKPTFSLYGYSYNLSMKK